MSSFVEVLTPPTRTVEARKLTPDQKRQIEVLNAHFNAPGYTLPTIEGSDKQSALTEREMITLSVGTYVRYLAVADGDTNKAIQMLEKMMIWRRTVGMDDMEALAKEVEPDCRSGFLRLQGFDPNGSPIMYDFPNREIPTNPDTRRSLPTSFMADRSSDLMIDGVESFVMIYNFNAKRDKGPKPPSLSVTISKENIGNLEAYAPEALRGLHFQNMPFYAKMFLNVIWPFMDKRTTSKVQQMSGADGIKKGFFDPKQLLKECDGQLDMPYNHEEYWAALLKVCGELRAEHLKNWRALGPPLCGRDEYDFKVSRGNFKH